MTRTPETLKAAEKHSKTEFFQITAETSFLAGYDYRQKEIDELVKLLEHSNMGHQGMEQPSFSDRKE